MNGSDKVMAAAAFLMVSGLFAGSAVVFILGYGAFFGVVCCIPRS
jgi:hypothetical protein